MRQVEGLIQGSLEWHEHRAKYRNASEAGAVMGVSPFQTPRELWESKNGQGKPFTGNVATNYGNEMEPVALDAVRDLLNCKVAPAVVVEGEYSASLDAFGLDKDRKTCSIEIKCPYQRENSKLWASIQDGVIPDTYYWQLVHQYMVCPAEKAYFFVYVSDDTYNLTEFLPNQGDIEKLKAAWDDFYANPPAPKFAVRDELLGLAAKYVDLKSAADRANKALKEIETKLKEACPEDSIIGNVTVQTITRAGSVDYKSIPELAGVDTEAYRKASTTYQKVTIK